MAPRRFAVAGLFCAVGLILLTSCQHAGSQLLREEFSAPDWCLMRSAHPNDGMVRHAYTDARATGLCPTSDPLRADRVRSGIHPESTVIASISMQGFCLSQLDESRGSALTVGIKTGTPSNRLVDSLHFS